MKKADFELTDIETKKEAEEVAQRQKDLGAKSVKIVKEGGTYTVQVWYGESDTSSSVPAGTGDSGPASEGGTATTEFSGDLPSSVGGEPGETPRILSKNGVRLIQAFESCERALGGGKFRAYYDPVGVLTIGWGHTNHLGQAFDEDTVWTQQECDGAFRNDMKYFEAAVTKLVKVPLNQNQFDALVSFSYNCGETNLAQSTLLKLVNVGDFAGAAKEFGKWVKAKGIVLKGLVRRRASEALLFQGIADLDYDGTPDGPMPQLVDSPSPSANLKGFGLDPKFESGLASLLDRCAKLKLDFRINQGLRSPQTQARYYCQWNKRTPQDIDATAQKMEANGAPWLASLLLQYRDIPRTPKWLTSALPGAGWHQWGEAADCYCYRNGKMIEDGGDECYQSYATAAQSLGLTPGLYFSKPDAGHVQLRPQAGATSLYAWSYIDGIMKERFSEKLESVA